MTPKCETFITNSNYNSKLYNFTNLAIKTRNMKSPCQKDYYTITPQKDTTPQSMHSLKFSQRSSPEKKQINSLKNKGKIWKS